MENFTDAKIYIDALRSQSIHSIIKERSEFREYLDDESSEHHFQMLWMMLNDLLNYSKDIVADSKKIYEFTLFAPKYDSIDLLSYFSDETIVMLYKKFQSNEQSKIFGYNALVQFLIPQKKPIAFSFLKKILTLISSEIKNLGNEADQSKNPLLKLGSFYTKIEYMKLAIHKPQEITNYITDIFKFLETYQAIRISSHLSTLPVYFFFKIVKFVSKVLNRNPEANPSSLICLLSLQPIILIAYRLPNNIYYKKSTFLGLTPLSTYQTFFPNEFPQFLIPYYYKMFFSIFEFFIIFARKPKPSNNDPHDLQIILDAFKFVSICEAGKDSFLLCLSFFMKSPNHTYVLFRLYRYLEMKERSIIHDYCVMIFIIALNCHYLPHTRNVLKFKHRVYLLKVVSCIEKNYENSPFKEKVSFTKKILLGESVISPNMSLTQRYKLLLSSNNYSRKQEKIFKILHESIQYLNNPDIYTCFCLLIINTIPKITIKANSSHHLISILSLFVYSHDFTDIPKYHYLQVLKHYSLLCLSNISSTIRSLYSLSKFKNPSNYIGISIIYSRYHPISATSGLHLSLFLNKLAPIIIDKLIHSELPHFLILLNEIITSSIRHFNFTFEKIWEYLAIINNTLASSFTARRSMRVIAAASAVDGFEKFIASYSQNNMLLELIKSIGEKSPDDIPGTTSFINIWRIIGTVQRKHESQVASLINLSYRVKKSRFFFESLFQVLINMSNPLLDVLGIEEWQMSPMLVVFLKCLPINISGYPKLKEAKQNNANRKINGIDDFKKTAFQLTPLKTLAEGITGSYYACEARLV